jgi:hypothetical protein
MIGRIAIRARATVPWRLAAVVALLSTLLGAALAHTLAEPPSSMPAATRAATVPHASLSGLPLAARGTVSSALGASDPRYRVSAVDGALQAANPAQRLHVRFLGSRVLLSSGSTRLALSLRGVGFGVALTPVGAAAPQPQANRVLYAHPGLGEWYANGPLGLEQGFTVERAPAGLASAPLTISLSLAGDVRAALARGGRSILFTSRGGPSLRYGDLAVSDASGRPLRSWLALQGKQVLLRIDARGARYPLRVDPLAEQATLPAPEAAGVGLIGYSVALSQDGSTALVGAPKGTGGAWVFVRAGANWTLQQELVGGEAGGDESEQCGGEAHEVEGCGFGRSVALSADGDTALIGAPRADESAGEAVVFVREGAVWHARKSLSGGGAGGRFGKSVALSADGQTALVGAPASRVAAGSAWVFRRENEEGSAWSSGEELTGGTQSSEGHFGVSVALNANGTTALVGAPTAIGVSWNAQAQRATSSANVGAAWAFTRASASEPFPAEGEQLAVTGANEGERELGEGRFGYSVALSANGDSALIGARTDDEGAGAAWVFTRAGAQTWAQGPKLTAGTETAHAWFGYSVALSGNGETALIGAPTATGSKGAAWLFAGSGSSWSEQQELQAGEKEGLTGSFGLGVALAADGEHALIGAPTDGGGVGAASAYGVGPSVSAVRPDEGLASGGTRVEITGTGFEEDGASVVEGIEFGVGDPVASSAIAVNSPTSITVTTPASKVVGAVNVVVRANGEESATSRADEFTYLARPKADETGKEKTPPPSPSPSETHDESGSGNGSSGGGGSGGGSVLAFGPVTGTASCAVALSSRGVSVKAPNRASVKLVSTGVDFAGLCVGRLTIEVKVKLETKKGHKARFAARTVATATFSIDSGRSTTVTVKLNAAGRALLAEHRGRMSAKLVILQASPGPVGVHSAIVRLVLQKAHTAKKHKKQ